MENAIQIKNAGKCIGSTWIFRDVTVSFERGRIHGLIGRNGAGKTMLLRSICGLTRITTGSIVVNGKQVGVDIDVPDSVGAVIEVPGFLPHLSGFANLQYLAGLRRRIGEEQIRKAIELVGLSSQSKQHVGKYSLGMRQRLGIAQAIMEDPDILLLDEPMNGLDNDGVRDVKKLLSELRQQGKTILLASHHMEDIAELCDTVSVMDAGRLKRQR